MLRGPATISFFADDVAAAEAWYATVLGTEAYFKRDLDGVLVYAEFRIGDQQTELGLVDSRFAVGGQQDKPGGAVLYWHVDDVTAACERLLDLGAAPHQQVTERGPGFTTASVLDPFGNILGIMYNQHYLDTQ
jgi:uncharacterized glyoxalase superfamily protein PhnB